MKIIKASEFNEDDKGYVLYLSKNEVRLMDSLAAKVLVSPSSLVGTENSRAQLQLWRNRITAAGVSRLFNYFNGSIDLAAHADTYLSKEKP